MSVALEKFPPVLRKSAHGRLPARIWKERWLFLMLLPGLLYFVIYKYVPMAGLVMAFQSFQPRSGFLGSPWVGLRHFERLVREPEFWLLFRNTMLLAVYSIVIYFPVPITLALLMNEIRVTGFKRFVQTVTYLPHFLSWVVVVGLTQNLLAIDDGLVNQVLAALGVGKVNFLMSAAWFRPVVVLQDIWKDAGWGSIIFLAALAGVDVQLYESAVIEGANRWQQLRYITVPSIQSTIVIILILRLGRFLDVRLEQILLMVNPLNQEVGDVFDTYVYVAGILQAQFSYSAAVGLFKSVVGLAMVLGSNWLARRVGEEGVF
jgi:putative aldouronate transport system permease protein